MELIAASNNKHKIIELKRILKPLDIEIFTLKDKNIEISEIKEDGSTFAQNARIKAKAVYDLIHMPVIADDSGLCVDALNGEPGVYTARYAGPGASDEEKYNKILQKLEGIPEKERKAKFVTSICCIIDENNIITAEGICQGSIAFEPLGENGFGYDPIFMTELGKTFAQLTDAEKDSLSHRGRALKEFYKKINDFLKKKG